MWELLLQPFVLLGLLTALVLAGIHTYLGFHVVSRGVIFVDLCLAQAAAFGAAAAFAFGLEGHGAGRYFVSLAFTMLGAGLISIARMRDERVPQEAFIGILYAAFTTGTILLLAKRAGGSEEMNEMLSGSLLTVQPSHLIKVTILYALVGAFHYIFRNRFITISQNRLKAHAAGWKVRWWDFLFYASFGVVVTSSVELAGVMMVFALLVVPPVIAVFFSDKLGARLAIGWGVGLAAALFGMLSSLQFDLPVGPAIVAVLVLGLTIGILLKPHRTNAKE